MEDPKPLAIRPLWPQMAATLVACQIPVVIGVMTSLGSIILAQEDELCTVSMSQQQRIWIVSILPLSAIVANVVGGYLQRRVGVRRLMLYISVLSTVCWLGHGFLGGSFMALIALRAATTGVVATATAASLTYISEMAASEHRGALAAASDISIKVGFLLALPLGRLLPWRYTAVVAGSIPSLLLLIGCLLLPETPHWLEARGRHQEAVQAAQFLSPDASHGETALRDITGGPEREKTPQLHHVLHLIFQPHNIRSVLVLMGQFTLYTMSGALAVNSYVLVVLRDTFGGRMDEYWCACIVQIIALAGNIVCSLLQDRCGRRALLVASGVGMACCLLPLTYFYYHYHQHPHSSPLGPTGSVHWIPLPLLIGWLLAFSLGSPVTWTLLVELLPRPVRYVASNGILLYWSAIYFALVFVYPQARVALGEAAVYGVFGFCCLLQTLYAWKVLPETRVQHLHMIHQTTDTVQQKYQLNVE